MPPRHTTADIERGLTALAISSGSLKAAEMTGFNPRTIRRWANEHPARYADIKSRRAALIDQACLDEFRQVVFRGTRVTVKAINKADELLDAGDVKDPAGMARNTATATAIAADKIAMMEGRPTSIVEHRSVDDVMRGLANAGFVDSTATESIDIGASQTAFRPRTAPTNARSDVPQLEP